MSDNLFEFKPAEEYLRLPKEPQPWVVKHLIPVGGLVNLYGKPKSGKSLLALGMCQAIANEWDEWEGFEIKKPGPVAYLQIDTPREEMSERIARIELKPAALYVADMWSIPKYPFNILDPQELQWLRAEMARVEPIMVVIDTLRESHGGDENDSTVMRNVIGNLVSACRPASIMLISHQRKDAIEMQGAEELMDGNRGSSYVAGRMDVIMRLTTKRLTYKGRAVGQQVVDVQQNPQTLLIELKQNEREIQEQIEQLIGRHPQDSVHQLAIKLAALQKFSLSTATRKINKYREIQKQA